MAFGMAPPDLMPGARNAVQTCLAVQPGEHVALIADKASSAVAASIALALEERRATFTGLLLEDFGPRPVTEAPREVLEALERADVGVLCVNPQPGELGARMAIVKVVERRQIRYAHMVGVTPEIMQQGMRSDYRMIDRLSDKLRDRMLRAETLTVKSGAFRPRPRLGQDERPHQPSLLVQPARGRSVYHSSHGRRHIRLRRHRRRSLQRKIR
jgi:aminopeptidase